METYLTIQKGVKSRKLSLAVGIFQVFIAAMLIYLNREALIISNYIFAPMMFLLGITSILEAMGKSFLFTNNIFINAEKIIQTKGTLKKSQSIEWKDVISIKEKPTEIQLTTHHNDSYTFNFSEFPYQDVRKAKEFIRQIALEKGINYGNPILLEK